MQNIQSPLQAQVVQWLVSPGANVRPGDVLVILEAMKMEHEIRASQAGCVGETFYQAGEPVAEGDVLCSLMAVSFLGWPCTYSHFTMYLLSLYGGHYNTFIEPSQ